MKMFSDCSGPCDTCMNSGGCMAGHGDDDYVEITPERIKEREKRIKRRAEKQELLDSAEKCGKLEVEGKQFMIVNFNAPTQFNEGDALTVWYEGEDDNGRPKLRIQIERT